jgi:hypothetical protein
MFPDAAKMAALAALSESCEPIAYDVIGFMDSVALNLERPCETTNQNLMYNWWHSNSTMNNIITYGADGMVFMGRVNFPVSWHN